MHELASTLLPDPLQPLTCLHSHTALKIFLCGRAPISALTHPCRLTGSWSCCALTICLQCWNLIGMLTPPYALANPPLTILKLPYQIHRIWWIVCIQDERNHRNMHSGLLCKHHLREIGGAIHNVVRVQMMRLTN
ncbi:hypothetical protein O181_024860 [Austropuccinia psidii MF-1]|uniref:Uncharacterized protein n=1 Tax=Austropuccinia psidii MF-1 TaxID=1389203 RepID=A0A9Q3CLL7_9BASI|nr:hypothetical protein [Austropuccinia psidii MF-1]